MREPQEGPCLSGWVGSRYRWLRCALALVLLGGVPLAGSGAEEPAPETAPSPGLFAPIDLSPHYVTKWDTIRPGTSWSAVPKGEQVIDGVPFQLGGLIEVSGMGALQDAKGFPTRVSGVVIGRKAGALHVIHGAGYAVPDSTTIGKLVLHYANGEKRSLPIQYGVHVRNWWVEKNETSSALSDPDSRVAWTGTSAETDRYGVTLRLMHTRFANPLPEETLQTVDVVSALSRATPVILGLTVEAPGTIAAAPRQGAAVAVPAGSEFAPVDLSRSYTSSFQQIDRDPDSSWAYAPHGRQTFNGVPFDLGGIMEVSGLRAAREANALPTSVRDIPVGRKARRLHVLHGGAENLRDGTPLAKLVLHHANGEERALTIVFGHNVRNWYRSENDSDVVTDAETRVGWTGDSPRSRRYRCTLRLYHTVFELPLPEVELRTIDHVSLLSESVSVITGMTLELGAAPGRLAPVLVQVQPVAEAQVPTETRVRVVDAASGQPIAAAIVRAQIADREASYQFGDQKADAQGRAVLDFPPGELKQAAVMVRAPEYRPRWETFVESKVPREIVVKLERGTRIGGIVQDEARQPIAGVQIRIEGGVADSAGVVHPSELETVSTDAQGRWSSSAAPPNAEGLRFALKHPDWMPAMYDGPPAEDAAGGLSLKALLGGTAVMTLEPAIRVVGRMTDEAGRAVAGAEVTVASGEGLVNRRAATTDAEGRFQIRVPETGEAHLIARAKGHAPHFQSFALEPALKPLDLSMSPSQTVRGQVRDHTGLPVAGARVALAGWPSAEQPLFTWQTETGADGSFEWNEAPTDPVMLQVGKPGCEPTSISTARMADGRLPIWLAKLATFTGKVVDAETKRPVEAFSLIRGRVWNVVAEGLEGVEWESNEATSHRDGSFAVALGVTPGSQVRFVALADGYQAAASPVFSDGVSQEFTFELKKGAGPHGQVVTTDGRPVAGADVAALGTGWLMLRQGALSSMNRGANHITTTDEQGRFSLPTFVPTPGFVAAHEQHGFARITTDELARSGKIVLQSWGRVEGTLKVGAKPAAQQYVMLNWGDCSAAFEESRLHFDGESYRARTDAEGRFAFDQVPPGPQRVVRLIPVGPRSQMYSHGTEVDVIPGQTNRVVLGGTGRLVVGAVMFGETNREIPWENLYGTLTTRMPQPPANLRAPEDYRRWYASSEVRAVLANRRLYAVTWPTNGLFRIDDVAAGTYELHLQLLESDGNSPLGDIEVASTNHEVVVPEMPDGRSDDPLDVGELKLTFASEEDLAIRRQQNQMQMVGSGEQLPTLDGAAIAADALASGRVLLTFWATTNAASVAELRQLGQAHTRWAKDGRLSMFGVVMDDDLEAARRMAEEAKVGWPQIVPPPAIKAAMLNELGEVELPVSVLGQAGTEPLRNLRGDAVLRAVDEALGTTPDVK